MFCSFGTAPRILRLFCWGSVVEKGNGGFEELVGRMMEGREKVEGVRAVVLLRVWKVRWIFFFAFLRCLFVYLLTYIGLLSFFLSIHSFPTHNTPFLPVLTTQ